MRFSLLFNHLSIRAIFLTLLALLPSAAGAETFTIEGVTYTTTTGNECKISGSTADLPENLIIPATVTYNDIEYNVTAIDKSVFSGKTNVKTIDIQAPITTIETGTFKKMTQLTNIILPEGITSIGSGAFEECSALENIKMPKDLKTIADFAFSKCSALKSIQLPETVISLGNYSFRGCSSLKELILPEGILTINGSAFSECSALESIYLPSTVNKLGTNVFEKCSSLKEITIPEGVTSLGNQVFRECTSLVSVQLPSTLTSLGEYCFQNCNNLETVKMPPSMKSISKYCFYWCNSLKEITVPEGITVLNERTFGNCNGLISVNLPSTLTKIDSYCFLNCSSLNDIELPESLTTLYSAFAGCTSLTSINIPSKITEIGSTCFDGCISLNSITLPDGLIRIGDTVFRNCKSLKTIEIPNSVTTIGSSIFENCSTLESISLPIGIKSISYKCFLNCSSLSEIEIPEGITEIAGSAFNGCTALKAINLPSSLTEIGTYAFSGCSSISTITIPEGVKSIGNHAFESCTALESVSLPSTISKIERQNFIYCSALKSIIIPDEVTSIEVEAFYGCTALQHVTIGRNVASIIDNSFGKCNNLETVTCRNLFPPSLNSQGFPQQAYTNATLKVDSSCEHLYRENATWSKFANIETIDFGYTSTFDSDEWELIKLLDTQLHDNGWTGNWHTEVGPNAAYQLAGITVENDHVVGINLPSCRVNAEAFATIMKFPLTKNINVSKNAIEGDIKDLIAESVINSNLTTLDISTNRMSGNLAWVNDRFPALTTLTANANGFTTIDPYINAKTLNIQYQNITEPVHLTLGKTDKQEALDAIPSIFFYEHYKKQYDLTKSLSITSSSDRISLKASISGDMLKFEPLNASNYPYTFKINENYELKMATVNGSSGTAPVILEFVEGDCNCDGVCDITDLQGLANYALGYGNYRVLFNEQVVNFDGNETLNVLDIIGLVNHLLNKEDEQSRATGSEPYVEVVSEAEMRIEGDKLLLDTDRPVAAIDFTVRASDGFVLSSELRDRGFTCATKRNGNMERVIVYSASGAQIPEGITAIGSAGMTDLSACLASSPEGNRIGIKIGRETSSLTDIEAACIDITIGAGTFRIPSNYDGARWSLYDMMGRLVAKGTINAATGINAPAASNYILILTKEGEENYSLKINL